MGVNIASHTHMCRHVIVNRGTLIGHHVKIEDYVTIDQVQMWQLLVASGWARL